MTFDGREVIYEFSVAGGTETIASCAIEVDPAQPPFSAVEAALAAVR